MRENTQLPLAASYEQSGAVNLHSWFPTIQGEGPFCGERALFFRLHGCNLRCPGCDTEYTKDKSHVAPSFFVNTAKDIGWPKGALVVITGGEPMRQNIGPLCRKLLAAGYRVQIETNGVLWASDLPTSYAKDVFSIVCSPKTIKLHDQIMQHAVAFKYVLQAGQVNPDDGLPIKALMHPASTQVARPPAGALVYVQPMDEDEPVANALNLDAAIRSCMDFGHRLQIQVHKHINME